LRNGPNSTSPTNELLIGARDRAQAGLVWTDVRTPAYPPNEHELQVGFACCGLRAGCFIGAKYYGI